MLQPVMARMVEGCSINAVHFTPSCIVTVSRAAAAKFWMRPKKVGPGHKGVNKVGQSMGREVKGGRDGLSVAAAS